MGIACAALHWSADQFWSSTPHEFFAAYECWIEILPILSPVPTGT